MTVEATASQPSPGVTAAAGFRASGVVAGLKSSGRPDLALVVNEGPSQVGAAVFTTNRVVGAPVVWSRQAVADGVVSAVVLNSGGANVCTGPDGFLDVHRTAEKVGVGARDLARRRRRLLDRPDRRAAAHRQGARGRRHGRLAPVPDGRPGRGDRDHDHRHRAQDRAPDDRRRPRPVDGRRHGQGCGHARAGPGDDALRHHDGRRRRRRHGRRRAAGRDQPDVRPDRLRRLHVHLGHGHAAGLGRQRLGAGPGGVHRSAHPGLRRAGPGADRGRRGRVARHRGHRHGCLERGRRPGRRAGRRAVQPVQGCDVRQRPQLGPGARAGGDGPGERRALRPRPARRHHQRRPGVQGGRRVRSRGPTSTWPRTARCTSSSTCTPGPRWSPSGPTTSRTTTSTRTARTPHERPVRLQHPHRPAPRAEGRGADRGAAVAAEVRRCPRRRQVRRQRHDRRGPQARLRAGHGVPAAGRACGRSSCTGAVRRSTRCSTGSASSRSSAAACASPRPRPWTSCGWCSPGRSRASSSVCSTPTARTRSGCPARTAGCSRRVGARSSWTARASTSASSATSSRSTPVPCSTCSTPVASRSCRPSHPTSTTPRRCSTSTRTRPRRRSRSRWVPASSSS